MKQNRMERNWKQPKGNANDPPWDESAIDDQLVSRIRETYGNADDETEYQLSDRQARRKYMQRRLLNIIRRRAHWPARTADFRLGNSSLFPPPNYVRQRTYAEFLLQ